MITPKCTKQSNLSAESLYKILWFMKKLVETLQPNAVYNVIRDHFKAHFNDQNESKLEPFISNPRPFHTPITKDEVAKSIHKLRNNRAPRYDQIQPELLKYAPTELYDLIAESLNNIFSKTNISMLVMDC